MKNLFFISLLMLSNSLNSIIFVNRTSKTIILTCTTRQLDPQAVDLLSETQPEIQIDDLQDQESEPKQGKFAGDAIMLDFSKKAAPKKVVHVDLSSPKSPSVSTLSHGIILMPNASYEFEHYRTERELFQVMKNASNLASPVLYSIKLKDALLNDPDQVIVDGQEFGTTTFRMFSNNMYKIVERVEYLKQFPDESIESDKKETSDEEIEIKFYLIEASESSCRYCPCIIL